MVRLRVREDTRTRAGKEKDVTFQNHIGDYEGQTNGLRKTLYQASEKHIPSQPQLALDMLKPPHRTNQVLTPFPAITTLSPPSPIPLST